MSENRNVGCLCCVSGPLTVTVYTDRGGYCPGESIGVSAVINNQSNNEILGLEIHLIQLTVYIASGGKQILFINFHVLVVTNNTVCSMQQIAYIVLTTVIL